MLQLRGLFEGKISTGDPKPFRLVKTLYQSCLNKDAIEEKGTGPLLRVLHSMGGWPVLERGNWDQDQGREGGRWHMDF